MSPALIRARRHFLVAIFTLNFAICPVRGNSQLPEPQYLGQYEFLGPNGQLVPLESAQGKSETKSRSIIISNKVSTALVVQGAASTVRVGPLAHFIVRVSPGSDSIDPNTVITLRAFTVDGAKRTIPTASASTGFFQPLKGGTSAVATVPISFKKYGLTSLEIIPQQPLPPGEYLFGIPSTVQPLICFGVDANGPASASAVPIAAPAPPKPAPIPAFIKWSEPLQSPITSDVKAACESTDSARQAYCFGIFSTFFEAYEAEQDGENVHPFCYPKNVTAVTLRDAFLEEAKSQQDQLSGPIGIFWGVTEDHHFRCPAAAKPKRTTPAKKKP